MILENQTGDSGLGTTLIVCHITGRKGIGYELNPTYQPLIEKRIREPLQTQDWQNLDILSV